MFLEIAALNEVFRSVDLVLVVQIVLSILALLFSYDAISGEREGGTLFLMLSNSVSRGQVILGKYMGSMGILSFLLLTGLLSGLLVMLRSLSVDLGPSEWARVGMIFVLSLMYLSTFLLSGMLVSARAARTSTALILLFFLWVVLVMLVPNLGGYFARRVRPIESAEIAGGGWDAVWKRWNWDAVSPLDLTDMPGFEFKPESIGESVRGALSDLAILGVLNVLFFMGAYLAFLRKG